MFAEGFFFVAWRGHGPDGGRFFFAGRDGALRRPVIAAG